MGEAKTKTNHSISPRKAIVASLAFAVGAAVLYFAAQAGQTVLGCSGVNLYPNSDLQRAIDRASSGTTFCLQSGNFRITQALTPKKGQRFIGKTDTYVYGSIILDSTQAKELEPNVWQWNVDYPGNTKICQDDTGANLYQNALDCYPEELFVEDTILKHVSPSKPLLPGSWSFNYLEDTVTVYNSKPDAQIELSVAPAAFIGNASDVVLQNFHIVRFANPTNSGAVGGINTPSTWTLNNVIVKNNHGLAARLGEGTRINNSLFADNGQGGVWFAEGTRQSTLNTSVLKNNLRLSIKDSSRAAELIIAANNVLVEDTLLIGTKTGLQMNDANGLSLVNTRIDTANAVLNNVDGAQFSNSTFFFNDIAVNASSNVEFMNNTFASAKLIFSSTNQNANHKLLGNSFDFGELTTVTGTSKINGEPAMPSNVAEYRNNTYAINDESTWLWNGSDASLASWQELHGRSEESVESISIPSINFYNRLKIGPQN